MFCAFSAVCVFSLLASERDTIRGVLMVIGDIYIVRETTL